MSAPVLSFVHAPDNGWKLKAYGYEVTIWEDGDISIVRVI
jgi:hypothetical protein